MGTKEESTEQKMESVNLKTYQPTEFTQSEQEEENWLKNNNNNNSISGNLRTIIKKLTFIITGDIEDEEREYGTKKTIKK